MSESILTTDPAARAHEQRERDSLLTEMSLLKVELDRLHAEHDRADIAERHAWDSFEASDETDEGWRDKWNAAWFRLSELQEEIIGRKLQLAERVQRLKSLDQPGEVERRAKRIAKTAERIRGLRGRA